MLRWAIRAVAANGYKIKQFLNPKEQVVKQMMLKENLVTPKGKRILRKN